MLILYSLAIVVVVGGVFAALYFRVPARLGLVTPPEERLLSGTPDRAAAKALKDELARGGINTTGLEIFVLPIEGTDGSLAGAVLDASKGFRFQRTTGQDPIVDVMTRLTAGDTATTAGIKRVVVEYRSESGASLLTLTASTEAIAGFARGTLTREQFMKQLDGNANWPAFYQEAFK